MKTPAPPKRNPFVLPVTIRTGSGFMKDRRKKRQDRKSWRKEEGL